MPAKVKQRRPTKMPVLVQPTNSASNSLRSVTLKQIYDVSTSCLPTTCGCSCCSILDAELICALVASEQGIAQNPDDNYMVDGAKLETVCLPFDEVAHL
jgi:hypothetical protein